jgi:hypothetical protein
MALRAHRRRRIGYNYKSKQRGFNLFFHVCDLPYRVITLWQRAQCCQNRGIRRHELTHMANFMNLYLLTFYLLTITIKIVSTQILLTINIKNVSTFPC